MTACRVGQTKRVLGGVIDRRHSASAEHDRFMCRGAILWMLHFVPLFEESVHVAVLCWRLTPLQLFAGESVVVDWQRSSASGERSLIDLFYALYQDSQYPNDTVRHRLFVHHTHDRCQSSVHSMTANTLPALFIKRVALAFKNSKPDVYIRPFAALVQSLF